MSNWSRLLMTLLGVSLYMGCSGVKFSSKPSSSCQNFNTQFGDGTCIVTEEGNQAFDYNIRVGEVDILFVTDNSGSMYAEQQEMAHRFPGFLDSIFDLDYQIAIITTDVSASPNNAPNTFNGNGALQDGRFIMFPNGASVLSNPDQSASLHGQNILDFQNTIARPESATCDQSDYEDCPSSDERGIYAVNMALDRSENTSFFRQGGHLAIIILSDEDERSVGGHIKAEGGEPCPPENSNCLAKRFPLEDYDRPETLVDKTAAQLGATKTVSMHSIIVKPGDTQCKSEQDDQGNQWTYGEYGDVYERLSNPSNDLLARGRLMPGVTGSICSKNYTKELGDIKDKISQNISEIQLPCTPLLDTVDVTYAPLTSYEVRFDVDVNNRVTFSPSLPAGTSVNLKYECPRL